MLSYFSSRSRVAPTKRVRELGVLAILGLAVSVIDCTFLTAKTAGQCNNDSECRARGPSFASTRCSAAGICEAVSVPEAGIVSTGPCTSNAECNASLGKQARCVSSQCVALTNANCAHIDGDPTDPNAIFIGVMTPLTGANTAYGQNQYDVVATAAKEWNGQIAGQAGAHSFVTISCDEIADPGGTSTFLASNVQVSAIFGPIYDGDFAQAVFAASLNGTFLIGPRVDDPTFSTFTGAGRVVWSYQPNRKIQEAYFQNLINTLEPSVKAMFSISGDMKVAMVVGTDPSTTNFVKDVEQTLTFNGGKTIGANGSNYVRVPVSIDFTTANDYSAAVLALVQAAPDFVIVPEEYDLLSFVRAVNAGWSGPKFPRFLLMTEDPAVDLEVLNVNERFAGKLDVVTWAKSAQETTNATAFAVSYRTATSSDPAGFSESLYDSFYENAYALQSVLDANGDVTFAVDPGTYSTSITGFNAPGSAVNTGPTAVGQMLTNLSSKVDVDLDGASGPLEFDSKGTPVQNAVLNCVKSGAASVTSSGVTFDGKTGAASGSYVCL